MRQWESEQTPPKRLHYRITYVSRHPLLIINKYTANTAIRTQKILDLKEAGNN